MKNIREKLEAVTDFLSLGFKITLGGDCSHEIRRWLHLGRKAMTNLDSAMKSIDITLLIKVSVVKTMVFPVVTYGCESWTVKKAECQWIDTFKLWCWRRLLIPLNSKEIKPVNLKWNQPWILIGRTDAEAEAPVFWCKESTHWKRPWCWERLKARGEGDDRGWDGWMASPTQWTWVWTNSGRQWRTGDLGVVQSTRLQRVRKNLATEKQQQNQYPADLKMKVLKIIFEEDFN